jgi:hypothetical protein
MLKRVSGSALALGTLTRKCGMSAAAALGCSVAAPAGGTERARRGAAGWRSSVGVGASMLGASGALGTSVSASISNETDASAGWTASDRRCPNAKPAAAPA